MILAIIIFVIFLGILLFLHEAGHFLAAKIFKIKVEEFGIGYPPRIWKKKIKGTVYSLNLLPFGGFVKILGEDDNTSLSKDLEREDKEKLSSPSSSQKGIEYLAEKKRNFRHQNFYKKFIILFAGIFINFLAGVFFLSIGYLIGPPSLSSGQETENLKNIQLSILSVDKDSPAEISGLKPGDIVLKISSKEDFLDKNIDIKSFQEFVSENKGKELVLNINRIETENLEFSVLARENPPSGKGSMGITIGEVGVAQYGFFKSVGQAAKTAGRIFVGTFIALYYLIAGLFVKSNIVGDLVGPVGIAVIGGQTVELGIGYLLQFLAGLSVNLAALNLIPFPALDGSRIIFAILEKIKRKSVSSKIESNFHASGFLILLGLLIFITIRDIIKLF